jgi:hypothetical protein
MNDNSAMMDTFSRHDKEGCCCINRAGWKVVSLHINGLDIHLLHFADASYCCHGIVQVEQGDHCFAHIDDFTYFLPCSSTSR